MKSTKPKIGDTLWGVWEHRYYNERRLVELEYVVYPVKITRFFRGRYVDAHCVGIYKEKKNFLMCSEYSAAIFGKYTKHTATGATTCVNMYSRSDSKFPARTSM